MDKKLLCKVCGLEQPCLQWGENGCCPTYDICDCCGVEFGYEDSCEESVIEYRANWINKGRKWFNKKECPVDWDWKQQLQQLLN